MIAKILDRLVKAKTQLSKRTVCLDFDGVIHWYRKGWHNGKVYDVPTPGCKEVLEWLHKKNYYIVVFTARDDLHAISRWLDDWGLIVDKVTRIKPWASLYVDDKAISFSCPCDWKKVVKEVKGLNPDARDQKHTCTKCVGKGG